MAPKKGVVLRGGRVGEGQQKDLQISRVCGGGGHLWPFRPSRGKCTGSFTQWGALTILLTLCTTSTFSHIGIKEIKGGKRRGWRS